MNQRQLFEHSKNPNASFVKIGESHPDNYFGSWESSAKEQLKYLQGFL